MGIFVGLLFGLGLLLIVMSGRERAPRAQTESRWRRETRDLLAQAGAGSVTPDQLIAISVGVGVLVAVIVLVVTATWSLAGAIGIFAAFGPRTLVVRRARQRSSDLRELWPDAVDNLGSAVRAGMSLPEAVASLAQRGPVPLRPAFARFGEEYRATGSFSSCLDRLADDLADPVADRIIESLRMVREVGGTDLGRLLRTLSQFLRDDARVRAELEARQSWTVNAARLALAAPWLVLLLLATRSSTVRAYDRPTGVLILAVGGVVSVSAYFLMKRLGRLPVETRALRAPRRVGPPAAPGARRGSDGGSLAITSGGRRP